MMPRTRRRVLLALLSGTLLALVLAPAILAHSELVSSDPGDGATVQSPYRGPIVLTFTEHLATGSKAALLSPSGTSTQDATVSGALMTFSLTAPLDPGAYQVQWTSVADDGDLLRGIVKFTVAAAVTSAPSASPSTEPSATSATSSSPSAPSPASATAASPAPSSTGTPAAGSGSDVILPIVVALIVLGAGAAYLLRQRARPAKGG